MQGRPAAALARRCALMFIIASIVVGAAGSAEAVPRVVRASTRPWFATFGFGPAIRLDELPNQFKIEQVIGYHFFGKGEGPALGGAITQAFGDGWFNIGLGLRFWWDIQPVRGLGLYLAPFMHVGWSLFSYNECPRNVDCTRNLFDWQIGFEPRLVLGDRGMIFWRLVAINPLFGQTVGARYDMLFGGGVTF
ncbi:MAG: hypothetical protein CSA65_02555 [Proteobacteria bacterium]|nr:MAG: hypothetical protein CSA65_02555 [Pseudomonadota bacterium]